MIIAPSNTTNTLVVTGVNGGGTQAAPITSIALPPHRAGDTLLLFCASTASTPSIPTATGTVPTWTSIATSTYQRICFAAATANNHTSGTWGGSTFTMIAVSVAGGNATKAVRASGATATFSGTTTTTVTAPAVTLADNSGRSAVIHFLTTYNGGSTLNWSGVPDGYTLRGTSTAAGVHLWRCLSRDLTTTAPAVAQAMTSATGQSVGSVEVRF